MNNIKYRGQEAEEAVLNYIKENYDSEAVLQGGMDSTSNDIISPVLGAIEVKETIAQCGQFTIGTADKYKYSNEIIAAFNNDFHNNAVLTDSILCAKWIKDYYLNQKQVNYFGLYNKKTKKIYLLTPEEFFNQCSFSCTYRAKQSGTSSAPKWVDKYVKPEWDVYRTADNKLYARNFNPNDDSQVVYGTDTRGNLKKISIRPSGEIRVHSNTKNDSFVFSIYKED